MLALTIRQPWAGLVALGIKDIENRSWRPPDELVGDRLAIHAGRHQPAPSKHDRHDLCCKFGFVIATVRLEGVYVDAKSRWAAPGQWHWRFDDVEVLENPAPARGRLGLWTWS